MSEFTFIGVRPRSICSGARKSFGSLRRNLQLPTRNRSGETIDGRTVPETSRGAIKAHEQNRTAAASGAPPPAPSPLPYTHDAMDHGEVKPGWFTGRIPEPPPPPPFHQHVLVITPKPGPFECWRGGRGGRSRLTYCSCQREAGVWGGLT